MMELADSVKCFAASELVEQAQARKWPTFYYELFLIKGKGRNRMRR